MSTIIYTGGFELPDRNAAAQRVLANSRIFRELGYRVVLLGTSKDRLYDGKIYEADSGAHDIEAWETGYPTSSRQWFESIASGAAIKKLVDQTNIKELTAVICYNYPAIAQWRIAKIARNFGGKAVADCTEWYENRPWSSIANIVKNIDVPLRMHWINKQMDGLITTSPFITRFYKNTGKPIVEIPTLIDAPTSYLDTIQFLRPDGRIELFFAGTGFELSPSNSSRHTFKDRLDWVLELLHMLKKKGGKFHLNLYGVERAGYLRLVPEHSLLLDELGDYLTFHGRQPRSVLLEKLHMSAFSIFFRKETRVTLAGFPTKYSESVSNGTPVITNDLESLRAYHVEERTGFTLDPADIERSSDTLLTLFNDSSDKIAAMKQYCRQSTAFHYSSFEGPVRQFVNALRNV